MSSIVYVQGIVPSSLQSKTASIQGTKWDPGTKVYTVTAVQSVPGANAAFWIREFLAGALGLRETKALFKFDSDQCVLRQILVAALLNNMLTWILLMWSLVDIRLILEVKVSIDLERSPGGSLNDNVHMYYEYILQAESWTSPSGF